MSRFSLYRLSSFVTLLSLHYSPSPSFSPLQPQLGHIAYLIYGVMQAGSELSWHLSGPRFAKQEDSSSYSAVNVLAVGLRSLIAPCLGSLLAPTLAHRWF